MAMRALEMVRMRCALCEAQVVIDAFLVEAGAVHAICGGQLVEEGRTAKTFGTGLCRTSKYRYDSPSAADRARRAVRRKRHQTLYVYRCSACFGWHLGSSISRGRSAR